MDTWTMTKWMSEANKVFKAVTTGPTDAINFGEKTQKNEPYMDCNTKHETQGWRTRSGSGNDSHALTDQIIVDVRLRDTDDGYSYNANYASKHSQKLKITHDGDTIYTWEMSGVQDAATNDWTSSKAFLITKPGVWKLSAIPEASPCDIEDVIDDGWETVGEFTAKDPHEGCYASSRDEGATMGECGDCWENYTEDTNGDCILDSQDNGGNGEEDESDEEITNLPLIIGGVVVFLALMLMKKG